MIVSSAISGTFVDEVDDALEDTTDETGPADSGDDSDAGVGEPVRDGNFEFTVGDVEQGETTIGDDILSEEAQGEFVIIDLTVKNIGDEAGTFFDSDQKLFDTDGNEYSASSEAGLLLEGNDVWLTEINPGNQVEGKIVFDIPTGTTPATLELHDSAFSGGVEVSLE
ncbi:DUF4352 domain-containing protein [Glycomyces rhizosphaerae]|uniref:DUF4352 domain-containing protein n=1 Tax=Glycomyces rhizosphaerae TaxID=2054422 RepID=A0ABV7PV42_9ACTN